MPLEIKRLGSDEQSLAEETIRNLKLIDSARGQLEFSYLRSFLAKRENFLIVALDEDRPIGFLIAYLMDRVDRDQRMMLLYEISVDSNHRRKQAAKGMVRLLKKLCHDLDVMKMWVYTNQSNQPAVNLYRSCGGEAATSGDEVSFTFWPPYEDRLTPPNS